ncbi:MAG: hypothetical protein KME50_21525 [Nostoc desertorum CM1-VF14]|nr:hypothetical protein [Nostoc desertorum CM1-VF14]
MQTLRERLMKFLWRKQSWLRKTSHPHKLLSCTSATIDLMPIRIEQTEEYRMSQNQILSTIAINRNWLITLSFKAPKVYQRLVREGLNHVTLFAEYTVNGVETRAETIQVKDARIIWRYFDTKGNAQAQKLIDAL